MYRNQAVPKVRNLAYRLTYLPTYLPTYRHIIAATDFLLLAKAVRLKT